MYTPDVLTIGYLLHFMMELKIKQKTTQKQSLKTEIGKKILVYFFFPSVNKVYIIYWLFNW